MYDAEGQAVPVSAISRHRIGVDGEGVTTLVAFQVCPLHCKFCLNPQTLDIDGPHKDYTAAELYETVRIDSLYFLATGGGVTFGGGEPLLRSSFIREFRSICGTEWKINIETSLNVPSERLEEVMDVADFFIIDIKDMDGDIYSAYTGKGNGLVKENLRILADAGAARRCRIRLPLIPGFNSEQDRDRSQKVLDGMGFEIFDRFDYIVR